MRLATFNLESFGGERTGEPETLARLDVMRAAFFADLADFDTLLTSGDPGRAWRDRRARPT